LVFNIPLLVDTWDGGGVAVKLSSYYRNRNPLYADTVALPIEVRIR
jgi:hypothetical protein